MLAAEVAEAVVHTVFARARRGPLRPSWPFWLEVAVRFFRADFARLDRVSPSLMRTTLDRRPYPLARALRRRVKVRAAVGCPVPGWWFEPIGAQPGVLLYFHGGGFLFGSARTTHFELLHRLAAASGHAVLGIDYRLAPEHPFPAAIDDASAVWAWLSSTRAVIAGDSAGGHLCVALSQRLVAASAPLPLGAALLSPWVDFLCERDSATRNEPFDYGTAERLRQWARLFADGVALGDPRLSVGRGALGGLPPLWVQWGEAEIMADDCAAFAERAAAAGVDVTREVLRDLPHDGPMLALVSPEAARGVESVATWVQQRLR